MYLTLNCHYRLMWTFIPATQWQTACVASCRIEVVLSSEATIVIQCCNIFLFAVIFCPYWTDSDPMPLTFSRGRFPINLSLQFFFDFEVLVVALLIMLDYRDFFFFLFGTSLWSTLPFKFSMLWKISHIVMLMLAIWSSLPGATLRFRWDVDQLCSICELFSLSNTTS